jgi:farnesyl-diphosphate farnesyltransferase
VNDIGYWLDKTSRTFAVAIPLLEEPTRRDVSLAYLLFRIADTLEDSVQLTPDERVEALDELAALIARPESIEAHRLAQKWCRLRSVENPS